MDDTTAAAAAVADRSRCKPRPAWLAARNNSATSERYRDLQDIHCSKWSQPRKNHCPIPPSAFFRVCKVTITGAAASREVIFSHREIHTPSSATAPPRSFRLCVASCLLLLRCTPMSPCISADQRGERRRGDGTVVGGCSIFEKPCHAAARRIKGSVPEGGRAAADGLPFLAIPSPYSPPYGEGRRRV